MLTCFWLFLGHSLSKCSYNNRYSKSRIYSDIRLLQCIIKLHNAQLISFHRTALLYCLSSCKLKGDGLVANVIILEGHFFKILSNIIGIKKLYLVWSTIQSILIKHSMYIKHLPNSFERTDALIEGKHLRVFHLVIPCYCLAWKTLYWVDREQGDFCVRLSTHVF